MAIVNLYKVIWQNNRHNNANTQTSTDFVVAAAGASAQSLASSIQTNNGDGKTVTVVNSYIEKTGIIQ
jgi:L-2-hydroxyglutarate oxidase LhgO